MVPLAEVFDIQQGKALSAQARNAQERYPFLRTVNVLWNQIDISTLDRMGLSPGERTRLALEPGDLLVCEGGEIGRAAVWQGELTECYYQNHIHRLRIRVPADSAFYQYWLRYAFTMTDRYEGAGTKTTIANLSRGRLAALLVPLPPLDEQRRIARILSTVQSSHVAYASEAQALSSLARSAIWPMITATGAPDVELGSLLTASQNGLYKNSSFYGTGTMIVRVDDFGPGCQIVESVPKRVNINAKEFALWELQDGDILVNRVNGRRELVGKACLVRPSAPMVFESNMMRIRIDQLRMLPEFLLLFLWTDEGRARTIARAGRGNQFSINQGGLSSIRVPCPELAEQRRVAFLWSCMMRARSATAETVSATQLVFKSTLARLMEPAG